MSPPDTVTFGIPLMGRSAAQDWARIEHSLSATIGSIYNQTDPNFRIIVACTDVPTLNIETDARLEFIACEQLPAVDHVVFISDAIRKRFRIAQRLRQLGGGYLMLADADDLVSRNLVAYVRKTAHPHGHLVSHGYMFDATRGWLAPFPFAETERFDLESHTCAVFNLAPDELPASDDDRDNRFTYLMHQGHPAFKARAEREGRPLLDIPFRAAVYVRNTGENVSTREAATTAHGRVGFQAHLDDQLEAQRIERTPELDAEFNLKAAHAPQFGVPSMRQFRPFLGLSVLVATHRRPEGLRRLLTALRPQVERHPERSIVVINDGSHDDAYASVVREFADIITYRDLPKAEGLGAVRNAAIVECAGAYAVFTDDDCEPPPWWLDWLSARLRTHPEIDVFVGSTRPLWTTQKLHERVQGDCFLPQPSRLGRWDLFVTACVAIRADLMRDLGGFLPAVSIGEDTDLGIRLHRAQARFAFDGNWWVCHAVDKPLLNLARRYRQYGEAQARIGAAMAIEAPRGLGGRLIAHLPSVLRIFVGYFRKMRSSEESRVDSVRGAAYATLVQVSYLRGLAAAPGERSPP